MGGRFLKNSLSQQFLSKQCHNGCEIFRLMGDCIMPREGIFAKVLRGGMISEGDEITVEKRPLRAAILTASDSGYAGERSAYRQNPSCPSQCFSFPSHFTSFPMCIDHVCDDFILLYDTLFTL